MIRIAYKCAGLSSLLLAVALITAPGPAMSETIYRWVDSEGIKHYGDRPVPHADSVRVRDGKPVPSSKKENSEDEEMTQLREEQCQLAKARYGEYSESNRMIEKDAFGKERELSPEERLAAIAKAKNDVETYCD